MRNYRRLLGVLLATHWTLDEIELGVSDKVYDTLTGDHFYEKKIVRTKLGGTLDVQWIKQRIEESKMDAILQQDTQEDTSQLPEEHANDTLEPPIDDSVHETVKVKQSDS